MFIIKDQIRIILLLVLPLSKTSIFPHFIQKEFCQMCRCTTHRKAYNKGKLDERTPFLMDRRIKNLVLSSLFASLCCITTMIIQIPAPTGYVNLGDCAVLLSAWTLGPLWGGAAAGIGTMMADILNGWASYAPATFVIKFTMAVMASLTFHRIQNKWGPLISGIVAESIMVSGYFLYENYVLGL